MIARAAIALAVAAVGTAAGWTVQGWRADAALSVLRNQHADAARKLADSNARYMLRTWERGDELAAKLAIQQAHIQQLHQDKNNAITRLTTGRACLSAELVRVLNNTDPASTNRPDPVPPPTGSPAAADAPTFATDADVSTWAATAQAQYNDCSARLEKLIDWHTTQPKNISDER